VPFLKSPRPVGYIAQAATACGTGTIGAHSQKPATLFESKSRRPQGPALQKNTFLDVRQEKRNAFPLDCQEEGLALMLASSWIKFSGRTRRKIRWASRHWQTPPTADSV